MFLRFITSIGLIILILAPAGQNTRGYFKIAVVDEETGRGVPLVELRTTSELRLYTDSNGLIAFLA